MASLGVLSRHHRVADSSRVGGASSEPADLEAQRIQVDAAAADEEMRATSSSSKSSSRRDLLRVSPFVLFLLPVIFFYCSAVLASYTLHFGSGNDVCSSDLRLYLWGVVIMGYVFVLGFAWLIVGPRVDRLSLKWLALLLFFVLLGVLTAFGVRQLINQSSSAWYRTCWVVSGFYGVFWVFLAVMFLYELCRSLCCPSPARVIILGVGAGFSRITLQPTSQKGIFSTFTRKKPPRSDADAIDHPALVSATAASRSADRSRIELELAGLDHSSAISEDIKKDNFFGSDATEKRRSREQPSVANDADAPRPSMFAHLRIGSSVAPSPVESEDEADPPFVDPLTQPTPAKRQILPPLNQVAHLSDSDDDHDDPFAAKIAANRAEQEVRRREMEELHKATMVLREANAAAAAAPPPPPPTALEAIFPASLTAPSPMAVVVGAPVGSDAPGRVTPALFLAPAPAPAPSPLPTGILKSTRSNPDRMKTVDWASGSRLERVHDLSHVEEEASMTPEPASSERQRPPRQLPSMSHVPTVPPISSDLAYAPDVAPLPLPPTTAAAPSSESAATPPPISSSTEVQPEPDDGHRFSRLHQRRMEAKQQE